MMSPSWMMNPAPTRALAAALLALFLGWSALTSTAQDRGGPARGREAAQDPPAPRPAPPEPNMAEADRYFDICDYDGNGWISFREASACLGLDQVRFSAYDQNRDGLISREEFRSVYAATVRSLGSFRPPRPDPTAGLPAPEAESATEPALQPLSFPTTVNELFGRAEARENQDEIIPRPPRIPGPVPVFRRLDLDGDGRIARGDLEDLLRPLHVPVRINAVMASLDTNGDGTIDEAEFRAAMGD